MPVQLVEAAVREADLAWGENTALNTFRSLKTTTRVEELENPTTDRINIRHLLGLPCVSGEDMLAALVFIRFGGPEIPSRSGPAGRICRRPRSPAPPTPALGREDRPAGSAPTAG